MTPQTFAEAFTDVQKLVGNFQINEQEYLKSTYQEAHVRQHFLDKFFVALGWDVYHQEQSNPYEREVKIEQSVRVQGRGKRADYAFYTAPNFAQARFMAEAKKPSRHLENAQDCFQAIRYGWNSNSPISVLTDFEQFLVLDSRYKPTVETAANRILKKFHYTEYADEEKFREIYYLFSREAVGNNALENYARTFRKSRGARQAKLFQTAQMQPVGETFLAELDEHREELARAFKRRNAELDGDALTEIVQRTLDRLVFLRFLEDKLVEPSEIIDNLGTKSGSAWRDFAAEMPRLNKIYNGIIFKPHAILDSPTFTPDERAFEQTRDWLAHRNSAYDFNTIPIHILGSIYERFLGKIIVTTAKQADVKEKPEVRKAGGVYYTPEYIVRYIVENTIGKLLYRSSEFQLQLSSSPRKKPAKAGTQNATPEEISEMCFADIACGSGSFLLGVFDYLIAYHVKYYNQNKTRRDKAIKDGLCRETADGILQLSISHKREILENNIYGVDLDAQAVEVAQLSLYLKLLEEETTATKQQFLAGFREQLLPSLDKNIVHGNSLIDEDIDFGLFDHKDLKRLNPMNFQRTFKEVFDKGGFDAIVGNPPYGADLTEASRRYLKRKFEIGTTDSAALMMIQAIGLTKTDARIGLIVPKPFTFSSTWEISRNNLIENLEVLVDTGKVWKEVKLEQVICLFSKGSQKITEYKSFKRNKEEFEFLAEISKEFVEEFGFYLNGLSENEILIGRKIYKVGSFLGDLVKNTRGGMFQNEVTNERESLRVIGGKQINRFLINGQKGFIKNKKTLPTNSFVSANDILVQNIVAHIMNPTDHIKIIGAVVDKSSASEIAILDTVNRLSNHSEMSSNYLLGLLHSKLLNWYVYRFIFAKAIRTMHFDAPVSDKLPIRTIDFTNPPEKAAHDKVVELVEKMLDGKKKLAAARTDADKRFYERLCNSLDARIDDLVYTLYDITSDERKIIEG